MFLRLLAVILLLCENPAVSIASRHTPVPPKSSPDSVQQMRLQWFHYDHDLPLDIQISPLDKIPFATRYLVSFMSVHDQRVPAILAIPTVGHAPYPCVMLLHGSGGNKDSSYVKESSIAMCQIGCATISIDSQYSGARKLPDRNNNIFLPNSYTARDAWVQTVIDLRRTVDYLQTRSDINSNRLGFLGFSQGAMIGADFGGIDKRVGVFCLAVPGGALAKVVQHLDRYPALEQHWPFKITPKTMQVVDNVTEITDPIHYIADISPRPLLIYTAKYDQIIPPESSKALIAAARVNPNLQVVQVDASHVLNPMIVFSIRAYFKKMLVLPAHLRDGLSVK